MSAETQTGSGGSASDHGQNQTNDPGLNTAMDQWGGENAPVQTSPPQTQTSPGQKQTIPDKTAGTAEEGTTGTQPADKTQVQTQTQAPPDTAALIRAAVESTAQAMARQTTNATTIQQPATPPMSDAEFAKHYGLPSVDGKALERLFDKDPTQGAAFLNDLLRQTYIGALKMSKDLMEVQMAQRMEALQPRLSTVERFIAEQTEAKAGERFYATFPKLSEERDLVKEVLDATQAKIARGELRFTEEKQAFQYVADATNKVLSRMTPASGTSRGQQNPSGQRTMASATSSARPGGQKATGSGDEMATMMSSWDVRPE